jgi:N-acetyl-anhydromuramyl-L-alanine amidase AmpD
VQQVSADIIDEQPSSNWRCLRRYLPLLGLALVATLWLLHLANSTNIPPAGGLLQASTITPIAPIRPWRHIVIHHSGTDHGNSQIIDHDHFANKGWDGVGYHFVIGNGKGMPAGQIDATFRWYRQRHGAHASNREYNEYGIGICVIGNYNRDPLPALLLERCAHLCALLITTNPTLRIDAVIGHRKVKATKCPGRFFSIARLQRRIRQLLPVYRQAALDANNASNVYQPQSPLTQ